MKSLLRQGVRTNWGKPGGSVLRLLVELVESSKHRVLIQANILPAAVYGQKDLLQAVARAHKRGVEFTLLLGPDFKKGSVKLPKLLATSSFISSSSLPQAFVVVDDTRIYYETAGPSGSWLRHPELAWDAPESAFALLSQMVKAIKEAVPFLDWDTTEKNT